MYNSNMCGGGYCGSDDVSFSKADRAALLKEKESILEAKLATIRHWMENLDKEDSQSDKK